MGCGGFTSNKVRLFPLLLLCLTAGFILTVVAFRSDHSARTSSPSSSTDSDGRSLRNRTISESSRGKDGGEGDGQQQDWELNDLNLTEPLSVVEAYRAWDSEVGCGRFQGKVRDIMRKNSWSRSLQPGDLVKCANLKQTHVSVLVKSSTWIPDALNGFHHCSCGLTCLWTKSGAIADDPDVHFYESAIPPFRRQQGEPLRAYLEMEAHHSRSNQEDIFVGFHAKKADVQATYASNALAMDRNHFISHTKRRDALVYWSSSRCVAQRQEIASSFLPLVSHHSFGKCLNNVGRNINSDEDPLFDMYPECKIDDHGSGWTRHIHCAMSHYMFALAIENTMTESYVTEKLFYALDVGTVPIYYGAPNVLDLVPPNSIILASDFNSTENLAAYVHKVARNPVLYAEFHAWRRCRELGNFRHTWSVSFDNLPCRVCALASKMGGKDNEPSE